MFFTKTLVFVLLCGVSIASSAVWSEFESFDGYKCQSTELPSDQYFQSSFPYDLKMPSGYKWCKKAGRSGCANKFFQTAHAIYTPFLRSLNGFRAQIVWNHTESTSSSSPIQVGNEWSVFYYHEKCFSGGVEFGLLYWFKHGNLRYYLSTETNKPTQKWTDKPLDYVPIVGLNYVNFTMIFDGDNRAFYVSLDSYNENMQSVKSFTRTLPFPSWMVETRGNDGGVCATIKKAGNAGKENFETNEAIKIEKLEFTVDQNWLNSNGPLVG